MSTMPLSYQSNPPHIPPLPPLEMAPAHALYSTQAVGLATFLGSPLAGTIVMASNYRRLGRSGTAMTAITCGGIATAVLCGIGWMLPAHSPAYLVSIISLLILVKLAKSLQGEMVERHKLAGGKIESLWKATGIGVICLLAILGVIFGTILATTPSTRKLKVGQGEIIYSGAATQADAQALGKALTDDGYFTAGRAVSVILKKDAAGTTIEFVVKEEFAQKENTLSLFAKIGEGIAPSVGGKPLTVKLVNPELKELKSTKVE